MLEMTCPVCSKPFTANYAGRRCCGTDCARKLRGSSEDQFIANLKSAANGCLEWSRDRGPKGYGRVKVGGKKKMAHRHAWELMNGPIPKGLLVLHKCDNPPCCNTDHLFLGTQKDNLADMRAKGREVQVRGESHGRSKLNEEQALAILQDVKAGLTYMAIAIKFNVHYMHVYRIAKGIRWAHLPR